MLNYVQRIQSGRAIFIFIWFIFLAHTPFFQNRNANTFMFVMLLFFSWSSTPVQFFETHANVTDLVRLDNCWCLTPPFRAQPSSCAIPGGTPWP